MLADSGVHAMLASRIYAARQSVPYNGPSPSTSSSAVLMRHHVREMQTRCASVILTNIRYVRDLSGNPLCPRAAGHMSRNDRRITSHAAAACKTRLHAAPAAVRRAKAPRASGPRGIDWTGRENQWQWMTVPRTAASAVRNSLRARPRYVRFGQHVRYRLSDLSLRKETDSPVISASRHELRGLALC